MRRIAMVCAVTGIVLATLLAPAVALVPSNGVYSGVIDNIGEGTGFFRAKGAAATKHLVPPGSFASKVTGFTRLWDSNCDSGKVHWTMMPVSYRPTAGSAGRGTCAAQRFVGLGVDEGDECAPVDGREAPVRVERRDADRVAALW